jgi:hypothetical protein
MFSVISKFNRGLALLLGAAAFTAASSFASAGLVLVVDDDGTIGQDFIILDDVDGVGTVPDGLPGDGDILFNGSTANFVVTVAVGQSKPVIGSPTGVGLSVIAVSQNASSQLTVYLFDTDFVYAGPLFLDYAIGGTTDGSVIGAYAVDFDNSSGFSPDFVNFVGPFAPVAFSDSETAFVGNLASPFALGTLVEITHENIGDTTSLDATVRIIPEPASLLAMAGGLIALARRRK